MSRSWNVQRTQETGTSYLFLHKITARTHDAMTHEYWAVWKVLCNGKNNIAHNLKKVNVTD